MKTSKLLLPDSLLQEDYVMATAAVAPAAPPDIVGQLQQFLCIQFDRQEKKLDQLRAELEKRQDRLEAIFNNNHEELRKKKE